MSIEFYIYYKKISSPIPILTMFFNYKTHNNFEAVFITKDNKLYITEGIKDDITLLDGYSDICPNIINR